MELTPYLIDQIKNGKVVLFLGSGASCEAVDAKGNRPPTGKQLAKNISEKFLGGKFKDLPLHQVSEYAINESSLFAVQNFIKEIFEPFEPSEAHCLMATFKWAALASTNYDLLVEKAYEKVKDAPQMPAPFIENGDRPEDKLRDENAIQYLKLHGCITRIANSKCPLILTTDQYIEYRAGRDRIFTRLEELAYERTMVFVGHSLQDPDIRQILLELSKLSETRQRFYVIVPKIDDIEIRFWESKKITPIKGTFLDFVKALDKALPLPFRSIIPKKEFQHSIYEYFKSKDIKLSESSFQFLNVDVDYVKTSKSNNILDSRDFYKGHNPGWSAIEQNLDVRRNLVDRIITDHMLAEEGPSDGLQFVLIKGYAGSGKTVLLRRIAWDAAHDFNLLCLYLNPYGKISASALREIVNLTNRRVFLFVDNVASRSGEINRFANTIGVEGKHITIIGAERLNEWNTYCDAIADLVTKEYELKKLSQPEMIKLISLLEKHKALGILEEATQEERISAFEERAGRQLLVALHEATLGRPFVEIIKNEYDNIRPEGAQRIYLTICVLNRLYVPVRAGIISRLFGIPFVEFEKRFFAPLEKVVYTSYSDLIRDYVYEARHPHIAEIVFESVLDDPEKRFDVYIRCLQELNIDYQGDRKAFRQMIRGNTLKEIFPNYEHVKSIFEVAQKVAKNDPYLLHQMAIYEMNRVDGNLEKSLSLLKEASALYPDDLSIKHSIAEVYLHFAGKASRDSEKELFLNKAEKEAAALIAIDSSISHAYHTLIKAYLDRLEYQLKKSEFEGFVVEELVVKLKKTIEDALQKFPSSSYILDSDAKLAILLSDSKGARESLLKAFEANPRNSYVALGLFRQLLDNGEDVAAETIIKKALDANPNEKRIYYAYANYLISSEKGSGDMILYHLQRSFSPGDKNYIAQILFGRQLFINGNVKDSSIFYRQFRGIRTSPELRSKLRFPLKQVFKGEIVKKEIDYAFICRDGERDDVYANISNIEEDVWRKLVLGTRVSFRIAFTLRGVNAFDVRIIP
jgi:cold shock CspA family protein